MQNALVNVNGQILLPSQAKISVFDRAYLYGDSLYEVVRSYDGVFLHLDGHLERLAESARRCRMTLAQSTDDYKRQIQKTFEQFRTQPGMAKEDAYCRIIVSRGEGRIGFGLNCLTTPSLYVILMIPVGPFTTNMTPQGFEKGLHLSISARLRNDARALDPAMKSGNYLNSLLAYLEAAASDYDDAILLNSDGHVTEGTTFNAFYVRKGVIATSPLDIGILDGITRREVIRIARELGIEVREVRFPRERMLEADEVFITSSLKEVFPVTRLDKKKIGNGKPGPVTRKLAEAFKKEIEAQVAHAKQKAS